MKILLKRIGFYSILLSFTFLCASVQFLSSVIISRIGIIGKFTNHYILLFVKKSVVSILVVLLSLFTSTNIRIVGQESDIKKLCENQQIIMSNHLIYTDWIYIWIIYWYLNKSETITMFSANKFKYIPILGIVMYFMDFIFLKRDWSKDYNIMKKSLKKYCTSNKPFSLVIFPEGTVLCESTMNVCENYLEKYKLLYTLNKNTLLPRSKGIYTILNQLYCTDTLLDLTLHYHPFSSNICKYPYDLYSLEKVLFENKGPEKIDIFVKYYDKKNIPGFEPNNYDIEKSEQLQLFDDWLQKLYKDKSDFISDYDFEESTDLEYHTINVQPKIKDICNIILVVLLSYAVSLPILSYCFFSILWIFSKVSIA